VGYVYFVSYVIMRGTLDGGRNDTFGNTRLVLPRKISSITQIIQAERSISRRREAVILFYQYLGKDTKKRKKRSLN